VKWSLYDLDLRQWCIDNKKPIPGKPEAEYEVVAPYFNGITFSAGRDYKVWGKNAQVAVRLKDCSSSEDYWIKVRINAAKNLDKLIADSNRHRG